MPRIQLLEACICVWKWNAREEKQELPLKEGGLGRRSEGGHRVIDWRNLTMKSRMLSG